MTDQEAKAMALDFIRLTVAYRHVYGMTLREFGRMLNISAAAICRLEAGKLPDAVSFVKLIDFMRGEVRDRPW